jgi:hypothetical protein
VDYDAEFLLLTGNVWHDELTLRAWKSLEASCAALADYGIRVIWAGGPPDLADALRRMLADLPNLTLLPESDPDPVAIVREGRVIASLTATGPSSMDVIPASPPAATSFQIRVLPVARGAPVLPIIDEPDRTSETGALPIVDAALAGGVNYLAFGAASTRQSRCFEGGLVHHPGAVQAIAPHETGPRGCSLIEVPRDGAVRASFLPTSVVRWEQLRLGIDRETSRPQLIDRLQQQLLDVETVAGERLLCLRWLLVGSGPLFDALTTTGAPTELGADVEAGLLKQTCFNCGRARGTSTIRRCRRFWTIWTGTARMASTNCAASSPVPAPPPGGSAWPPASSGRTVARSSTLPAVSDETRC